MVSYVRQGPEGKHDEHAIPPTAKVTLGTIVNRYMTKHAEIQSWPHTLTSNLETPHSILSQF